MTGRIARPPRRAATPRPRRLEVVGTAARSAPVEAAEGEFLAPDEIVAPIAESLISEIANVRRPLDAELVPCAVFGLIEQGVVGEPAEREAALATLITQVVEHAERRGTADALALLRVFSLLGPRAARASADAAAERLAALGVPDRPWASTIGRPTVLRTWQYGDIFGEQESVGVLFSYPGRDHALAVLIDHTLGGGLKDCFLADGRGAADVLEVGRRAAAEPEVWFRDVDLATAAAVLCEAVEAPTVPVHDDQVEDVSALFHFTLARTEHLCGLAGLPIPAPQPALMP